jgi:hypothetical protein
MYNHNPSDSSDVSSLANQSMEVLLDSDRAGLSRTTINAVEAKTGMTALHFAAAKGHTEMVKFLLERGAGTD